MYTVPEKNIARLEAAGVKPVFVVANAKISVWVCGVIR